jgi:molybdenum cofactor cytidylyltransferase
LKIIAIVLAAGKSKRMGTNKLLLKVGDKSIIQHILSSLSALKTIVVLGHKSEDIKDIIEANGAKTVYNLEYEKGMTTSFQAGLKALPFEVEGVFMILGDTFGFKPKLLARMVKVMENDPEALIVSPIFKGKKGHPVLFRNKLFIEFLELKGGEPMKDLVNRHESHHRFVNADEWCIIELNTCEDYERVRKLWDTRKSQFNFTYIKNG